MASKRALFKPATLDLDVGNKEQSQRRGLVQGRFVSGQPLPDSTMTVFGLPIADNNTDELSVTISSSDSLNDGNLTPPGQPSMSQRVEQRTFTPKYVSSALTQSTYENVHLATPTSPFKPAPTSALDLSDTERSIPMTRTARMPPSSVLLVDASGSLLDPGRSEVETSTDLVISPAKVICHVPSVVKRDLRVGTVSTVQPLGDQGVTQVMGSTPSSSSLQRNAGRTPVIRKESAGLPPERLEFGSRDIDDEAPARAKTEPSVKEKKSKKTKVVQSRYMQTTNKSTRSTSLRSQGEVMTAPPRGRHGSTVPSSRVNSGRKANAKTLHVKPPTSASSTQQPVARQRPQRQRSDSAAATQSPYSYTPMAHGRITSTPAISSSAMPPPDSLDASAIGLSSVQGHDISTFTAPGVATALAGKPSKEPVSYEDMLTQAWSMSSAHDSAYASMPTTSKKKNTTDVSQDYLDKLYARYMQSYYLDSKLEKTMKEQEKEIMSQMYELWHETEQLRSRKQDLEVDLASARHTNQLDQQLDVQISGLGPIVADIGQLKHKYSTLASALDTTRHQLGTTGIHVPQDEESYHRALVSALAESEQLLGEIHTTTRPHQPEVNKFANALQTLQKAVENEDIELKRCQELLSATCTLATHESSLHIQQIELC